MLGPRAITVLASLVLAACAGGDDAAMRQAKQECRDRGLTAATAAYDKCVFEVSERIYISWGRDRHSPGD